MKFGLVWLAICYFVAAALGQEQTILTGGIYTLDGRRLPGLLRFEGQHVGIRSNDIWQSIPLTNVASIDLRKFDPAPVANGIGFFGLYHPTTNQTATPFIRIDKEINFDWTPPLTHTQFTVRWTGKLEAPRSDLYTFHWQGHEGDKLNIDGRTIEIGKRSLQTNLTLQLEAGRPYLVEAEHRHKNKPGVTALLWSSPEMPKSLVPAACVSPVSRSEDHPFNYSTNTGLLATYYIGPDFQGRSFSHIESKPSKTWSAPVDAGWESMRKKWLDARARRESNITFLATLRRTHLQAQGTNEEESRKKLGQHLARYQKQLEELARKLQRAKDQRAKAEGDLARATQRNSSRLENYRNNLERAREEQQKEAALLAEKRREAKKISQFFADEQLASEAIEKDDQHLIYARMKQTAIASGVTVAPGIPASFFSVRWTGHIRPSVAGKWQFTISADEPSRFWLEDKLVIDSEKHEHELQAGRDYRLRIETTSTDGSGRMQFAASPLEGTAASDDCLHPSWPPTPEPESEPVFLLGPGVLLTSGMMINTPVTDCDESAIRLQGLFKDVPIPRTRVAQIVTAPCPADMLFDGFQDRQGVRLNNGDFSEGEFQHLKDGAIRLNSVLFGLRRFDAKREVSAVVLQPGLKLAPRFVVRTEAGESILASELEFSKENLIFPQSNGLSLPLNQVVRIRRIY